MTSPHALFVAGLTGLLVTAAPSVPAVGGEVGRCSMKAMVGPGNLDQTYVLVEAVNDSVQVRLGSHDWQDVTGDRNQGPAPADSTWGAVFRVLDVGRGGEDSPRLSEGDEIVVVPWAYDASCDYQIWNEGMDWARSGSQVFQLMRGRRLETEGRATFDVLGWHTPYPAGALIDHRTTPPASRDTWLPAEAYFDLISSMPRSGPPYGPEGGDRAETESVLAALAAWSDANPDLADAFPVPQLRDAYERRLR